MKILTNILVFFVVFAGLMACKSDRPPEQQHGSYPQAPNGVWIVNEGNFMFGNAEVSFYNPITKQTANSIYSEANQLPLGDVLQSMYFGPDSLVYLVVNNSSKIEIVHQRDFKQKARITGLTSPRYMEVFGNKAYVSDLYANGLHVIQLTTNEKIGFIPLRGWTEALVLNQQTLWISNMHTGKVYALNTQTDLITDSLQVGQEPNSMAQDSSGNLWVLCGGKDAEAGSLWKIDLQTRTVVQSWIFGNTQNRPTQLVFDASGNQLLWIFGDVQRFPLNTETWPAATHIAAQGRNFYGLGCAPNGDVYVSDAMDYVSRGQVLVHDVTGQQRHQFSAGVIPARFYFSRD